MKRVLNTMIILVVTLWCGTFDCAAQNLKTWNFDSDPPGAIAKGFTNEFGTWQVTADPNASSKPNVLAQTAKSANPDFNVSLASGTNYKDVDLTVRMKAVAGRNDQGGGLVWRAKDGKNYYIARYNPLEVYGFSVFCRDTIQRLNRVGGIVHLSQSVGDSSAESDAL